MKKGPTKQKNPATGMCVFHGKVAQINLSPHSVTFYHGNRNKAAVLSFSSTVPLTWGGDSEAVKRSSENYSGPPSRPHPSRAAMGRLLSFL